MTHQKRSIWDDLAEVGREILGKIDDILNPEQKRQRELARIPIPIRGNQHPPRNYEDYE